MSIFSAVQHERAPRTYSKKPSYFSDFSANAAGAAAVAAASNHHQIAPGSIHSGARPPLLNPLGIPHGMHPYYPLHHFKSFFPALFPHATSGEFIHNYNKISHRGLKLDGAIGQGETCNSPKSEIFFKILPVPHRKK